MGVLPILLNSASAKDGRMIYQDLKK